MTHAAAFLSGIVIGAIAATFLLFVSWPSEPPKATWRAWRDAEAPEGV